MTDNMGANMLRNTLRAAAIAAAAAPFAAAAAYDVDILPPASPIAQLQSQGSGGGVYRLLDPQPPAHAFYWLVEVERSGREQIYGPLDPQPVATTATLLTFVPIVRR